MWWFKCAKFPIGAYVENLVSANGTGLEVVGHLGSEALLDEVVTGGRP